MENSTSIQKIIKSSRGCCGEEELEEVKEAFDYGYFGLAYKVNELEEAISNYLGCGEDSTEPRHVICTNNGTNALHLALDTIGIKKGDEVILPSFTFVATAQAVSMTGATPVFCEVNPNTFCMDIEDVKKRVTSRTKAIIPVHYAGRPCDMDELLALGQEKNIRIVEDAAHAFGSYYKGKKIGSFGDITCFSFDSIKVMTCGEGGCVVANDDSFDDVSRQKRLLGIDRKTMHVKDWKKRSWIYDVPTIGYRYHMSNINAAIGLAQIKKVDGFITRRRELCNLYDKFLKDVRGIKTMPSKYDTITPFMYVIRVEEKKRNQLKDFLMQNDIESGINYIPCTHFTLYHHEGDEKEYAVTENIFDEILCLPLHFELTDDDVRRVVDVIKEFSLKNY